MAFAKYLNRPRLLILQYDIETVALAAVVWMLPVIIGVLSSHFVAGFFVGSIIGYIVIKYYPKYAYKTTPGLIEHYLYDIGLNDPNLKKDEDIKSNFTIPPGFVNVFTE